MSSLFEVPAQLAVILSFVATGGGDASQLDAIIPARVTAVSIERPLGFSDQMWLEALKFGSGGTKLEMHAQRIFKTSSGRYYVPSDQDRQKIASLKQDAAEVSIVAAGFARLNAAFMQSALERAPTAGELYLAHLFGSDTAIAMLETARRTPGAALSARFPEVAGTYPELARAGAPFQTVGGIVRRIVNAVDQNPVVETVSSVIDARSDEDRTLGPLRSDAGRFALVPKAEIATRGWEAAIIEAR